MTSKALSIFILSLAICLSSAQKLRGVSLEHDFPFPSDMNEEANLGLEEDNFEEYELNLEENTEDILIDDNGNICFTLLI